MAPKCSPKGEAYLHSKEAGGQAGFNEESFWKEGLASASSQKVCASEVGTVTKAAPVKSADVKPTVPAA